MATVSWTLCAYTMRCALNNVRKTTMKWPWIDKIYESKTFIHVHTLFQTRKLDQTEALVYEHMRILSIGCLYVIQISKMSQNIPRLCTTNTYYSTIGYGPE